MIGQVVGSYQVLGKLGEGGMGAVYLAEHPLIGKRAAIKVLLPHFSHNADMVNRFFNEARTTTLIRHPGLVDIYDFGYAQDGSAYIIMEYLEGESLAGLLRRYCPLPTQSIVLIGRQIAAAVAAANQAGIVHRDLKPDNVFLIADAEVAGGQRVKILDFGIAKLAGTPANSQHTIAGSLLGTPSYMSPEQCRGLPNIDHRADIYSLGCMLYEMAVGRVPFHGEGAGDVIAAHIYQAVTQPRAVDPRVDLELEAIIMRALEKAPEHRQQSMEVLAAELDRLWGRPSTSTGPMTPASGIAATGVRPPTLSPSTPTTLSYAPGQTQATPPRRRSTKAPFIVGGLIAAIGALAAVIAVTVDKKPAAEPDDEEEVVSTTDPSDQAPTKKKKKKKKPKFEVTELATNETETADTPSDGVRRTTPTAPKTTPEEEEEEEEEETPPAPTGMFGKINSGIRSFSTVLRRATEGEFHFKEGFILLRIRSRPAGAEVFYDGASIGKTPLKLDFEKGTDLLLFKIVLPGYEEQTQAALPDSDQNLFADLKKIPVKIAVTITTDPPGADVHHDGQVLGKTPLKLDLVETDESLKVQLKLEGYKDKELVIPQTKTAEFTAKLESACKKRKSEKDNRPSLIDPYDPCREK